MSKITPKNLSYDSTLPPFLQRLQQNNTNHDGRHERAIARPKKARTAQDDEDDAPTYVDEETNHTLSKEEYAAMVKGDDGEAKAAADEKSEATGEASNEEKESQVAQKEQTAAIGAMKKRKAGKLVGGVEEDVTEDRSTSKKDVKQGDQQEKKAESSKPKKKAKKIKLSFNEDEG